MDGVIVITLTLSNVSAVAKLARDTQGLNCLGKVEVLMLSNAVVWQLDRRTA